MRQNDEDMMRASKIRSLAAAIRLIPDGAIVALGGTASRRVPMAAIREIIRQHRRNLVVVAASANPGLALLAATGCALSTDADAAARLRAGALGLPLLPMPAGLTAPAHSRPFTDPFTGKTTLAVAALHPDFAILHAHRADASGTVQSTPDQPGAFDDELMLARAARSVIVTVEQIVSAETIASRPVETVFPGATVTCVAEAPFGAYPFAMDHRYTEDAISLDLCRQAAGGGPSLAAWLAEQVPGASDHWTYLNRVGARALMSVSLDRAARA